MSVSDICYKVNNNTMAFDLLPVSSIITSEDADKYRAKNYHIIFTKAEFEDKFPNLDITKFYYGKEMFPSIIYYDIEMLIYSTFLFNGKEYYKLNDTTTDEEEIIKVINWLKKLYHEKAFDVLLMRAEGAMRFYLLNYAISKDLIDQEKLYELFIDVYTSTDYGFTEISKNSINKILKYKTKEQKDETQNLLSNFDDVITIYRGEGNRATDFTEALSWTTDINVANFFAIRLSTSGARIIKAKVKKSDIIEYIDIRSENEVLVKPENIEIIEINKLYNATEVNKKYMDDISLYEYYKYKKMLRNIIDFRSNTQFHGKIHCLRVLLNAIFIANHEKISDQQDRNLLFMACISHDMAREHDGEDSCHGAMSYRALINDIIGRENKELEFLMKYHSLPDQQALIAIKEFSKDRQEMLKRLLFVLKDADGLDRVRFGIRELDINYLRLDFSKQLTLVALESVKRLRI